MSEIRPMTVSERLAMRLKGSPEPDNDAGYAMYPNWQLRMEARDAKANEDRIAALEAERGALLRLASAAQLLDLYVTYGFVSTRAREVVTAFQTALANPSLPASLKERSNE